ncbi:hypothetical protein KAT36_00930 [Candidatus Pacearchaeota archaeon]|nr:hypothetical protein [Candidatus Pacearchaeota archaeon]
MDEKSVFCEVTGVSCGSSVLGNKKGDYKWGIMLSLILGLMVLSLSLYFIFHELWTEEDTERQICRQSIQLRSLLPDATIAGFNVDSFKDEYPLKCRTHVVEISEREIREGEAGKIIAETMAECWALYDNGDASAFPAKFFKSSTCVPCARIHLTVEAKKELGSKKIDIRKALDLPMGKDYSYYLYLRDSGKKFSAFDFGNEVPFDLEGDGFYIGSDLTFWENVILKNKLNNGEFTARMRTLDISLPRVFDATKGDLLINYGIVTIQDEDFGDYIPYLFYFQTEQGNPFNEVSKDFIFNFWDLLPKALSSLWNVPEKGLDAFIKRDIGFCEEWEGIPA